MTDILLYIGVMCSAAAGTLLARWIERRWARRFQGKVEIPLHKNCDGFVIVGDGTITSNEEMLL